MKWWFRSMLAGMLLLSGCSFQTPQETLESALFDLVSVQVSPGNLNVPADSQTGVFISLAGTFSSSDTFSFSLLNAPTGVGLSNITLNVSTLVARRFRALLNVGANTPVGTHSLTLQVTSGTVSKATTVNLTVTQAVANPTFKITVDPNALEISRGSARSTFVFVSRIKGFNQNIIVSLDTSSTTLTGVTANPTTIASNAFLGGIALNANANASPFGLPFVTRLKGTAGAIVKQANLSITIKTPSGELDPGFGVAGVALANGGGGNVGVQSNDKIIIAKHAGPSFSNVIEVKRLNVNGSLDTNFGTSGISTVTVPNFEDTLLFEMIVAPDNKILLMVRGINGNVPNLTFKDTVVRLLANGQLDNSFGSGGRFTIPAPVASSGLLGMALQNDGRVILYGNGSDNDVFVQRMLANGSGLDSTFGTAGKVTLSISRFDFCSDAVVQPDGKVVLTGSTKFLNDDESVVVRLTSSGQLDTSFDRDGINRVNFGSLNFEGFDEVALDTQGRIVAVGVSTPITLNDKLVMARFNSNGNLDGNFSGNGKHEQDFGPIKSDMVLQPDNKLIVESGVRKLTRFLTNGNPDTSFSGDGIIDIANAINGLTDFVLDTKGRIITLGADGVARYAP